MCLIQSCPPTPRHSFLIKLHLFVFFILDCRTDRLGAVSPGSGGPAEARAGRGAGKPESGAIRCTHLQPSQRGNFVQLGVQIPPQSGSHSRDGVGRGHRQRCWGELRAWPNFLKPRWDRDIVRGRLDGSLVRDKRDKDEARGCCTICVSFAIFPLPHSIPVGPKCLNKPCQVPLLPLSLKTSILSTQLRVV